MAEGQRVRYAELTCTPYTSVAARHPDRGLHRGDRGRADRGGAGLRPGAALDLRHPGGERPAGGRRHAGVRPRAPRRRAGRVRPRRTGDRRAAGAVPAALRRGPRGRAAQRAARGRDHRAGDDLGRRCACSAPSGSATAPRPPRTRPCSRTWPRPGSAWRSARRRTSRRAPSRRSRSTRCAAFVEAGRDGLHQLRRPADVRHHPQPGVRRRGRPAGPGRGRPRATWRAAAVRASFAPDDVRTRVLAEIDHS